MALLMPSVKVRHDNLCNAHTVFNLLFQIAVCEAIKEDLMGMAAAKSRFYETVTDVNS